MAHIELQGLVPAVIITQLDSISIKTALTIPNKKGISYSGDLSVMIDCKEYAGSEITFSRGYLFHVQCKPVKDVSYPLYVSTSGSFLAQKSELKYYFEYKRERDGRYDDTDLIDNQLVLHDETYNPMSSLPCTGKMQAKRDTDHEDGSVKINKNDVECYECKIGFDGVMKHEPVISGEIMEMDGEFKLKPRKGWAERESGKPYKLRGDWEAVLRGHVTAEVGSVSISREYRKWCSNYYGWRTEITPSFVSIKAQGELVT